MNRYQTKGVVLKRLNYGEADRILTFFTQDRGKVSAIAKGVRKPKSKLAGGIELFSVCNIGGIKGKRELDTLVSSRLEQHFESIVTDYDRLQAAYEVLKIIDKITEDDADGAYFDLLVQTLELLDARKLSEDVVMCWFYMQSMKLNGSAPNVLEDAQGNQLEPDISYAFSTEDGAFFESEMGVFGANEIKAWRVFLSASNADLKKVRGLAEPAEKGRLALKAFVEFQI